MEHINTLFSNRLSFLKALRLSSLKKYFSNIDSVFTVSMIVFGIMGCLTVLYLQSSPFITDDNSQLLTGSNPNSQNTIQKAAVFASNPKSEKEQQYVHIAGSKKVGFPISFVIDTFEKDASYSFDFGNGVNLAVTERETRYTYNRPGMYKVNLNVAFQGETTVLPVGHLWVE